MAQIAPVLVAKFHLVCERVQRTIGNRYFSSLQFDEDIRLMDICRGIHLNDCKSRINPLP